MLSKTLGLQLKIVESIILRINQLIGKRNWDVLHIFSFDHKSLSYAILERH